MTFAVELHATVKLRTDVDVSEQILAASRARRVLDCRAGDAMSTIQADNIRQAFLASGAEGDPFGVRIANAAIAGTLDLRAATVSVPLHFTACTFANAPRLEGAELHELSITDGRRGGTSIKGVLGWSRLPGLLANGVRIRRDLLLSGTLITGKHRTSSSLSRTSAVWLTEARIGGRLLAVGTRIRATGDRAMQCDRSEVAGDVRLIRGFSANRELRLLAVQLAGSLDLREARLSAPDGRALDLGEATIGGSVFILGRPQWRKRPRICGRVEMGRTTIHGRVLIRNADLHAPAAGSGTHDYNSEESDTSTFLVAPGLTVHGEFGIEGETVVRGALRLAGAELHGGLRVSGGRLCNDGDVALDLSQSRLGSAMRMPGFRVHGTLNLANSRVAGPIDLSGMRVELPKDERCVIAVGAQVAGDVLIRGLTATGGSVNFRAATVGGVFDAEGAMLSNPTGKTLSLNLARVAGNVRLCSKFVSDGLVVLNRAVIEGRLRCDGATLAWHTQHAPDVPNGVQGEEREPNVRGSAIEAISTVVRSGIGLGWQVTSGAVDLTDARTSYLADNASSDWPDRSYLTGFAYERFAPLDMNEGHGVWDSRARRAWLTRLESDDPQPWEQVARVLRAHGDRPGAEAVLIAQRRRARQRGTGFAGRPVRRAWDTIQDFTVGYGYRPHRAAAVLLALIGAVALSLMLPGARASMTAALPPTVITADATITLPAAESCGDGRVRCFDPTLYAIDTVVPIIDLGQRDTWYPSGPWGTELGWWLNTSTIIGWIASTIAALSFARLGRSS